MTLGVGEGLPWSFSVRLFRNLECHPVSPGSPPALSCEWLCTGWWSVRQHRGRAGGHLAARSGQRRRWTLGASVAQLTQCRQEDRGRESERDCRRPPAVPGHHPPYSFCLSEPPHGHTDGVYVTVTCVPLQAILLGLRAEAGLFPEICWVTLDRWPFRSSVSSSLKQRNLPEPSVL